MNRPMDAVTERLEAAMAQNRQNQAMNEQVTAISNNPAAPYVAVVLPWDGAERSIALLCDRCGALVLDTGLHNRWHDQ